MDDTKLAHVYKDKNLFFLSYWSHFWANFIRLEHTILLSFSDIKAE